MLATVAGRRVSAGNLLCFSGSSGSLSPAPFSLNILGAPHPAKTHASMSGGGLTNVRKVEGLRPQRVRLRSGVYPHVKRVSVSAACAQASGVWPSKWHAPSKNKRVARFFLKPEQNGLDSPSNADF